MCQPILGRDIFNIQYGNINYPVNASYALTLLGQLLDNKSYTDKGRLFAHQALSCFTKPNHFIYGEGDLKLSNKGCRAVDLGYNVEESLPALALYGLHTHDEEVLGMVAQSLQTHLEFMLPDGGWDNSWGTRNYKWTYWGSRTTDGCQPAFALLAHRDARFYKAALKNTMLLQSVTHNGLLCGGPHYTLHGITPSVHHTFCHAKALTTILDKGDQWTTINPSKVILPRETVYGTRFFPEIQTYLVAKGNFRATVTGYDCQYKNYTGGHATGGALTMLWHPKTGPLLTGSMNQYQLLEADNMQPDTDPLSMPLTPRIQMQLNGQLYTNINDLTARIEVGQNNGTDVIKTYSTLVNKQQQPHSSQPLNCQVSYIFTPRKVSITFEHDGPEHGSTVDVIFPVIAPSTEKATIQRRQLLLAKQDALVKITASQDITQLPTTSGRIFNFVPGLEAIPLAFKSGVTINIEVS